MGKVTGGPVKKKPAKKPLKMEGVLAAKQKKGKHNRWDHNAANLKDWTKGADKRQAARSKAEEELDIEGQNIVLDKQMTDVYKRVEQLDSVNWSKKDKKDRMESEFVRLGGIPLRTNKCTFAKHLERVATRKRETAEKIAVEEETGVFDLVEGSKVKERRREGMLKGLRAVVDRKRQDKREGYVHKTALGAGKQGEVVLDKKKVRQMEIRNLKKVEFASTKGRSKSRGSMWDDKYDVNKFNDPRMLESGRFDQIGSQRLESARGGRAKQGKKRRRK